MICKKIRTFSASDEEIAMLKAIAQYHRQNKSATIAGLIKKEFWRVFPAGNDAIHPDGQARVLPVKPNPKESEA